ncbi:CRISPR-associated endonuclease Csn1 [Breznakia sp. PF5-3]|uniref:type II CRISPR RNA-guided endonuclease Cas9 n=1 Tax=unclassified Breznakia TaxID=2623764 RepID=UPI002406772B|nr:MULTISPECIES: type II CRISPR RNA-guided endonuclease Cas9 [unclassified Breznakia]MDF9824450.1 CRISPR-associated endonuclease Csn1 [Breznakia sp. PM6-1]MDF9835267.1 CRISPR-associated endonuclease Csn1 [Breznakia sp. PF5-3]MDF9837405.1 CRISPR-associated endonuclease Csn1 [Breznakia sp. PFB2-8]MDF9859340.1 CRISPR-associated endonuclease Csn1 [Breznakia sp. PH5-24]
MSKYDKNENEAYVIGLDIGTNSVGWSIVNERSKLMKKKKHNLMGVTLFSEGATAAERRSYRSNRRRMQRRKQRITWLQQLFEDLIMDKDPNFFHYLDASYYHLDDQVLTTKRRRENKYNIFNDDDFNDIDYYTKYKTIYNLRNDLMESDEQKDIRLIYLAIHHIIKYRGNFLYEGKSFETIENSAEEILEALELAYQDNSSESLAFIDKNKVILTLKDKTLSRSVKVKEVLTQINGLPPKAAKEMGNAIVGLKCNFSKLLEDDSVVIDGKEVKVVLNSDAYVEIEEQLLALIGDEKFAIIEQLKRLNSWFELQFLLKGKPNISKAMLAKYAQHQSDLKILKAVYKLLDKKVYNKMFSIETDQAASYTMYIKNGKGKKCDLEALKKQIKKDVKELSNNHIDELSSRLDSEDFMPLINSKENGAIPYQLHEKELIEILDKQGKFYPELNERKNKILSLVSYRIPYYVGPLISHQKDNSNYAWIQRSYEKITPWNFDDVVDKDSSAEKFIKRLTNFCTYLPSEKVIPKHSLLYSEYCVRSELNKVRVNDKLLETDTKNKIINDLFKVKKNVTSKNLHDWLIKENYPTINGEYSIKGYQGEKGFESSLKSYIDFNKIFGNINQHNYQEIEEIISWITIFEDKKILARKLEMNYKKYMDKFEEIKKLKYQGWSRLSKTFLEDLKTDVNGEDKSIIEILRTTNLNIMQIINSPKYKFNEIIANFNKNQNSELSLNEKIENLAGSPAIKKGIRVACNVVDELRKVMGYNPKAIYLEFARSDEASKRSDSRLKQIEKQYKEISLKDSLYGEAKQNLNNEERSSMQDLRRYLYYIQGGRCLYSMKRLDIENLSLYQIDHIRPQSLIKDDSIENLALVYSEYNQDKGDYNTALDVVPQNKISEIRQYWDYLFQKKLIGPKKYKSLTTANFTEYEVKGFINRQLVETRQIVKHVANILKDTYKETNIVAIKAQLNSDFRDLYNLPKVREVNDYHHAHDAYISCVVGNYILERYPKIEAEFAYNDYLKAKRKSGKVSKDKYGFIINSMKNGYVSPETGEIIWDQSNIEEVKRTLEYRDCYFNHLTEQGSGVFYKQNAERHDTINSKVPIKKGLDPNKYGGYSGVESAYSALVSYTDKNKEKMIVARITVEDSKLIENSQLELLEAIKKDDRLKSGENIKILRTMMKYQQLIVNNMNVYMSSPNEWINAKQLKLSWKQMQNLDLLFNIKKITVKKKVEEEGIDLDDIARESYCGLIEKMKSEYSLYLNIVKNLEERIDTFYELTLGDKVEILKQILIIMKRGPENGNLKMIGLSERIGRMGKKYTIPKNTLIIDSSITGIFTKKYKV